jgi:tryptophanyl-tRNA synthetase
MSKSLGNAIYLSDSPEVVVNKVKRAITDPARIHPTDKGHPEICNVFQYHKAFNKKEVGNIEEKCKSAQIGCVACKKRLIEVLNAFLEPIREKRKFYEGRDDLIREILSTGNERARKEGEETLKLVKELMHFNYKGILN